MFGLEKYIGIMKAGYTLAYESYLEQKKQTKILKEILKKINMGR